jgi:hypothetical protein
MGFVYYTNSGLAIINMTNKTRSRKANKGFGVGRVQVAKMVERMFNRRVELKSVSASTSASATAAAGTVLYFTPILQDDTTNGRTGDQILPDHVDLNITALATASESARYILFQDKFNDGTAPTVTQVLSSANYNANYNHINVILNKRFSIIDDIRLDLSLNGEVLKHHYKTYKLNGKIGFKDTGDTSASAGPRTLWLLYIGTSTHVVSDINYRLAYRDP